MTELSESMNVHAMIYFNSHLRAFRGTRLTRLILTAAIGGVLSITIAESAVAQVRSYDGSGNNLSSPDFGAAGQAFVRLAPSDYFDGISVPHEANRPNARVTSNLLGQQVDPTPSQRGLTSMVWQWGQFIDHDIALTETDTESFIIPVAATDILSPAIPMTRSRYDSSTGTTTPRQQINSTSSFIDASMVYGTTLDRANELRTMTAGKLKTSTGNLLPFNTSLLDNANDSGLVSDDELFLAGDRRANEQPGLTSMHTLFVREHNRLASELLAARPMASDEDIYQHARRIVSGIVQSITYKEFLPATIGAWAPEITQYDSSVNATLSNEFATAAFRFGHTMVTDHLIKPVREATTEVIALKDAFFDPSYFSTGSDVDEFLDGLQRQTQNESDLKVVEDLRSMLFGPAGSGGMDLMALNIQRGRDHGLPSYSEVASLFGLGPMNSFEDLTSDVELATKLETLYQDVNNVDLWVGMLAADRMPGTEFGLVLNNVVANEFQRLMKGDRFFFAWDDGLSELEKQQIMDTRLSDVIARNTNLNNVRANVFLSAVPEPSMLPLLIASVSAINLRRRR